MSDILANDDNLNYEDFNNGDAPDEDEDEFDMENEALNLLEELLSLTEPIKGRMSGGEFREWQRISARAADLRLADDTGIDPDDVVV